MIQTAQISELLAKPQLLVNANKDSLVKLTTELPYFAMGHYLNALQGETNIVSFDIWELYPVNRAMIAQIIALKNKPTEEEEQPNIEEVDNLINQQWESANYLESAGYNIAQEVSDDNAPKIDTDDQIVDNQNTESILSQEKEEKSLLVMMNFGEWLNFLTKKKETETAEQESKIELKSIWEKINENFKQQEDEQSDEIPEQVLTMAINSINQNETVVTESMATIYAKQGKVEKAIEIYKKLSLQNPDKSAYFANIISNLTK